MTAAAEHARERYREAIGEVAALPEVRSLAGARVCVAGFTGQIGSALVRVLTEANATVLAADPVHVTGVARRPPEADVVIETAYGDVAAIGTELPLESFTHVFYAVGVTSDYRSRPREVVESQLVGLDAFLRRVDPVCRFVFVSSARVYGRRPDDAPLLEESAALVEPMHLDNLYDSAKRLAESLCLWHTERRGRYVSVVRAGNVYGPERGRSTTSLDALVRGAAAGRIVLTGNRSSLRNYCCVADLVQGMLRTAVHGRAGCAYNIGSDEHLSTDEVVRAIAACIPGEVEIVGPAARGAPSYQRLDLSRARRELGYAPTVHFAEVLPAVVAELTASIT